MKIARLMLLLAVGGVLTACNKSKDLYEGFDRTGTQEQKELLPESEYLDFTTTNVVSFNVNYGALGKRILVEVYGEEPQLDYSPETGQTITGTPIYKMFTNDEGRFVADVALPSYLTKVWLHTASFGVPQFASADIVGGQVNLNLATSPAGARTTAGTRADGTHKIWDLGKVGSIQNLRAIVGWEGNAYGKIIDGNGGLLTAGSLSAEDLAAIKPYLGNEKTSEFNKYLVGTDAVNTTIYPTFTNSKGETVTTTSAQVYVTYVGEMGAWYQDGLGYYYYKTGEAPASRDAATKNLKHYMILPNSSLAGDPPYLGDHVGSQNGYYNYGQENAPAWANERIQLLFEDPETGEVTTNFPPGYTIGFFLVSKAKWQDNSCQDETWKVGLTQLWYSNEEWNNDSRKRHFAALGYKDKILYGVEDGQNTSYNDLVFTVEADPAGAIKNEERHDIVPDEGGETATETTYKTYAYEDIWPTGGDYDLNDVIIEHKRTVTFDSYNYVQEVEDIFTAVQPEGSADYDDGFAIQIPETLLGNITLPANTVEETETVDGKTVHTYILFYSAKNVRGREFVFKRTFGSKAVSKVALEADDYNPFVLSQYNPNAATRTEIHLPKHKATSKADTSMIGAEDDAYFINKDGKHPFSVMMPIRNFVAVTEQQPVESDYPSYTNWVESGMTTNQDWYNHHK